MQRNIVDHSLLPFGRRNGDFFAVSNIRVAYVLPYQVVHSCFLPWKFKSCYILESCKALAFIPCPNGCTSQGACQGRVHNTSYVSQSTLTLPCDFIGTYSSRISGYRIAMSFQCSPSLLFPCLCQLEEIRRRP